MTRTPRLKSVKVVSDIAFTEVLFEYVSSFSSYLFHRKKSFKESQSLDSVLIPYLKGVSAYKCVRNDVTLEQSAGLQHLYFSEFACENQIQRKSTTNDILCTAFWVAAATLVK